MPMDESVKRRHVARMQGKKAIIDAAIGRVG